MGFADDTIVAFTSDHGEFLGHHGLLHVGPPPYGDLCRVRFVMAGPGVPGGECSSTSNSHLDIAPTLLELASVDPGRASGDGNSLVPMLRGGRLRRQERFLEFHPRIDARVYNHSIVTDWWRLKLYPKGEPYWGRAARSRGRSGGAQESVQRPGPTRSTRPPRRASRLGLSDEARCLDRADRQVVGKPRRCGAPPKCVRATRAVHDLNGRPMRTRPRARTRCAAPVRTRLAIHSHGPAAGRCRSHWQRE